MIVGIGQAEVIERNIDGCVGGALDDPTTVEVGAVVAWVIRTGEARRSVNRIVLGTLCRNETSKTELSTLSRAYTEYSFMRPLPSQRYQKSTLKISILRPISTF